MPPANFKDLTGQVFNRLTILERAENDKHGGAMWKCLCECGNITTIRGAHIKNGRIKSCGCLNKEIRATPKYFTHGLSKSPEYTTWYSMKARCYNPKTRGFEHYGGRGISICKKWKNSFISFYKDMGQRPSAKHSIERINNEEGYSPENCCWATQQEQNNNMRRSHKITVRGQTKTMSEWAHSVGINKATLYSRITCGWSPEKAIFTPIRHR